MKYTIDGERVDRDRYQEYLIDIALDTLENISAYQDWMKDNDIEVGSEEDIGWQEWVIKECKSSLKYDEEHACGSVGD